MLHKLEGKKGRGGGRGAIHDVEPNFLAQSSKCRSDAPSTLGFMTFIAFMRSDNVTFRT